MFHYKICIQIFFRYELMLNDFLYLNNFFVTKVTLKWLLSFMSSRNKKERVNVSLQNLHSNVILLWAQAKWFLNLLIAKKLIFEWFFFHELNQQQSKFFLTIFAFKWFFLLWAHAMWFLNHLIPNQTEIDRIYKNHSTILLPFKWKCIN